MARTNAYKDLIRRDIDRINYRLKGIEQLLGTDSEQYERYVNSLTATLPEGSYTLSPDTGRIQIKASKVNLEGLKHEQLKPASNLPTAKQSVRKQKLELKRYKEAAGESGVSVSDQEALQELNAKTYVRSRENSKGKLRYSESAKADLSVKGRKSYTDIMNILRKAEEKDNGKTDEKKARAREASRRYYEKHKAEINARRRAKRAEARQRA